MKSLLLSIIIVALILISCKEDSPVDSSKQEVNETKVVNLSIGNKYSVHHVDFSGAVVFDWYQTKTILRDTTISGTKYFIYSSGEMIRCNSTSVFQWEGSVEKLLFRFDVKEGESVLYQGRQLKVTMVAIDTVYVGTQKVSGTQKVIDATNSHLSPDTTFSLTYATKFGLLMFRKSVPNKSWSISLSGAKIDTVSYGSIF